VASRVVIDTMSNPMLHCSRASPKVQFSGPHWTRNSSTQIDRRPCRTRLGSHRARMYWMLALSPGTSLPRRGSAVVTILRLRFARKCVAHNLPFVGKFSTMRVRRVALASAWLMICYERVLAMESWLDALSTARGEGLSGREPQSGSSMVRQRGAIW
jgi:hypothetical protein